MEANSDEDRMNETQNAHTKTKQGKKRRKMDEKEEKEESSDEMSEDEEEDISLVIKSKDGEEVEEIQVDFDFFNPKEIDYHWIKTFLKNYLDKTSFDIEGLTDLIIAQGKSFGTVIKVINYDEQTESFDPEEMITTNDEGVYGFISIINLTKHKNKQFVKDIRSFLMNKISDPSKRQELKNLFENDQKQLGLLLNERMVNIPPQIAAPLHKGLFDELQEAMKADKQSNPNQRSEFEFDNILMVTSSFQEKLETKKKKKPKISTHFYFKPEDEIYEKESSFVIRYPLAFEEDNVSQFALDSSFSQNRLILVFSTAKVPSILKQIQELLQS